MKFKVTRKCLEDIPFNIIVMFGDASMLQDHFWISSDLYIAFQSHPVESTLFLLYSVGSLTLKVISGATQVYIAFIRDSPSPGTDYWGSLYHMGNNFHRFYIASGHTLSPLYGSTSNIDKYSYQTC